MSRLHLLNWRWEGNGFVTDHQKLLLHLVDSPIQVVHQRLAHAWGTRVGNNLSARAEFQGLADVDVACSTHTQISFTQAELGLLRVAMNGSFYTRDKQFSSGKVSSKQCPWCEQEDSVHHRTWECSHFHNERNKIDAPLRHYLQSQPDCTRLHGWFTESAADVHFRRALCDIPDTTARFDQVSSLPDMMHLFTDGSAIAPQSRHLRVASWAVCLADLPLMEFPPVAMGGVPGLTQTVLRAETTAAISAFKFALSHQKPFFIWTDCQVVFDRIQAMVQNDNFGIPGRQKDHDLWNELQSLVFRGCRGGLFQRVLKISSHQDHQGFSDLVDQWAISGNEAADRAASWARNILPPVVMQAHHRLQVECTTRYRACRALHQLFVDIGNRVIGQKNALRAQEEAAWDRIAEALPIEAEVVSFQSLAPGIPEPEEHTLGEGFQLLYDWLLALTGEQGAEPLWLTSYQLLAHFQMSMNHLGFHYCRKNKVYEPLTARRPRKDFDFIRSAGWFCAMVKCFARLVGANLNVQPRMPHGSIFRCWQRCILLPASPNTFQRVHRMFHQRGTIAVKSVHSAFKQYSDFLPGTSS